MNILIVGSGIVGLSTALELALAGYKVKIVTRNYEEGASWVAGGMLAPFSEGLTGDLLDFSRKSLSLFPDFKLKVEETSRGKIPYKSGCVLRLALSEEEKERFEKLCSEYNSLGINFERFSEDKISLIQKNLSEEIRGGWFFPEEGDTDTERLMDSLLIALSNLGVRIEVDEIKEIYKEGKTVKELKGLKGIYSADFYVFATGFWSGKLLKVPVFPVKGQILKVKNPAPDKTLYAEGIYIIPKENYVLIGATSEERQTNPQPTLFALNYLSCKALKLFPPIVEAEFISLKTGFRPATPDGKPIMELGNNYTILTGFYRNGIMWTPIASKSVLEYLEKGVKSQYFELFSCRRFYNFEDDS